MIIIDNFTMKYIVKRRSKRKIYFFHSYYFNTDISFNILVKEIKFGTRVKTIIWRELCLRFLNLALVFILSQKTGNFWSFLTSISRLHNTKTKT